MRFAYCALHRFAHPGYGSRFPGAMQHAVMLRRTGIVTNTKRVMRGLDGVYDDPGSAQQREERRTASGTRA
jgi:hypothetical protein